MKLFALLLMFSMSLIGAEDPKKATIAALGVAHEPASTGLAEFHVFCGAPAQILLAVEAPLGSSLALVADSFQITSGISAPLRRGISLGDPVDFSKQTRHVVSVSLPVPEVERRTELRMRIKDVTSSQALGDFRLYVYPQEILEEFKSVFAAQGAEPTLCVFGPAKLIRKFLEAQKIPFNDCGQELPDEYKTGLVYLGECKTGAIEPRLSRMGKARVVYFPTDAGMLPGIYRFRTAEQFVTKVTLPILGNLFTNPLSQEIFTNLLLETQNATTR